MCSWTCRLFDWGGLVSGSLGLKTLGDIEVIVSGHELAGSSKGTCIAASYWLVDRASPGQGGLASNALTLAMLYGAGAAVTLSRNGSGSHNQGG